MTLNPAVLAIPKPSLGRIVIVHHDGAEFAGIVTGLSALDLPLVIHVTMFGPGTTPLPLMEIPHAVLECGTPCWTWPARV